MESVNAEEFTVEAVERVSMWHTGAGWPNDSQKHMSLNHLCMS